MVTWLQGRNIMIEGHGRSKLLSSWQLGSKAGDTARAVSGERKILKSCLHSLPRKTQKCPLGTPDVCQPISLIITCIFTFIFNTLKEKGMASFYFTGNTVYVELSCILLDKNLLHHYCFNFLFCVT